jgi:hypothetical protein
MLVKMRAQTKRLSPLGHVLHVMARSQLVRVPMVISKVHSDLIRLLIALRLLLHHLLVSAGGCRWARKTDYHASAHV